MLPLLSVNKSVRSALRWSSRLISLAIICTTALSLISVGLPRSPYLYIKRAVAVPKITILLKPHLDEVTYTFSSTSDHIYFRGTLRGERGEVISEASVTLRHPCLKTTQVQSGFEGEWSAQMRLSTPRRRELSEKCSALKSAQDHLKRGSRYAAKLTRSNTLDLHQRRALSHKRRASLSPTVSWTRLFELQTSALPSLLLEAHISSTVLSSERSVTVQARPTLISVDIDEPQIPRLIAHTTHEFPLSIRGHITRHPLERAPLTNLEVNVELIQMSTVNSSARHHQGSLARSHCDHSLSDKRGRWRLQCHFSVIEYGQHRLRLSVRDHQRDLFVAESSPFEVIAPITLKMTPPNTVNTRREITLRGTLGLSLPSSHHATSPQRNTGSRSAKLLRGLIKREEVAIGLRWQLRPSRLPDETAESKLITAHQREETQWKTHLIRPKTDGSWSQVFLLPPNVDAMFETQALQRAHVVRDSADQRSTDARRDRGWGEQWIPVGSLHSTSWIGIHEVWRVYLSWGLALIALCVVIFYLRRQGSLSPQSVERERAESPLEVMKVGWEQEESDTVRGDEENEPVVRLIIYNALTRVSIEGHLVITTEPHSVLELSGYRRRFELMLSGQAHSSLFEGYSASVPRAEGLTVNRSHISGERDRERATSSDRVVLWVTSPGYEPLLTVLPLPLPARGARLRLPLWPHREALGRMWSIFLSEGLQIEGRFGRGDQALLRENLRARGGEELTTLGDELNKALYDTAPLTAESLPRWALRLIEFAERKCPQWSPYQLTPPSDLERQRAKLARQTNSSAHPTELNEETP